MILVQEENYLSQSRHIWQGDTFKISAHVVRVAMSAEQDHPSIASWGSSPLGIRVAKTFIKKTQKGGVHPFQGITEEGSRPLLRQPSFTHQSATPRHADLPWYRSLEALPWWTEDFVFSAAHLAPEILPCKMLTTPLPMVLTPRPADRDSGTWAHYSHSLICVCVCVCVIFLLDC